MSRRYASKDEARQAVWNALQAARVACFPFPPHGRIPNFAGAQQAAERLLNYALFDEVHCIKCDPDAMPVLKKLAALSKVRLPISGGIGQRSELDR